MSLRVGQRCERLELDPVWVVDPWAGREGVARLVVEDGRVAELAWARRRANPEAAEGRASELLLLPGLTDLHTHLREPGDEDAETVATGLAAAAHGGFTTVCAMANTTPPADDPAVLQRIMAAARASGSPVRLAPYGTTTAGRAGKLLAPLGELAAAGAVGFSDDGAPIAEAALLGHALAYAGSLGRPIVEHAEDPSLAAGAEMREGLVALLLGLKGWPAAAESGAVARALVVLADVALAAPPGAGPRLHLTHLSTAGSVALVRAAKAAGLPVSADVTPHHLALHDGWVAGDRRPSWEAAADPWSGRPALPAQAPPYDPATRVNPPLAPPADALALWAGLADGTIDAIATDHAPHREVDKRVEYGMAAPGISGLETALGLVLAGVGAGLAPLSVVVEALSAGPRRVLGLEAGALAVGSVADLVLVDRADDRTISRSALLSKGANTPLLGRRLAGRVLLTVAGGHWAYLDADLDSPGRPPAGRKRTR